TLLHLNHDVALSSALVVLVPEAQQFLGTEPRATGHRRDHRDRRRPSGQPANGRPAPAAQLARLRGLLGLLVGEQGIDRMIVVVLAVVLAVVRFVVLAVVRVVVLVVLLAAAFVVVCVAFVPLVATE